MPISTQAKLLPRFSKIRVSAIGGKVEIPVDVRIIAATNRPPDEAIDSKSLSGRPLTPLERVSYPLPPLSHRKEDIPAIAAALMEQINKREGSRSPTCTRDAPIAPKSWTGPATSANCEM